MVGNLLFPSPICTIHQSTVGKSSTDLFFIEHGGTFMVLL